MTIIAAMRGTAFVFATVLWSATINANAHQDLPTPDVQPAGTILLNPAPGMSGIDAALLHGQLDAEGFYVLRVTFHPGAASPPHTHNQDRYITVIEGTWHFALGEDASCDTATPLEAGSFAYLPAEAVHFDGACGGQTTVQISGPGPVHTHYLGK